MIITELGSIGELLAAIATLGTVIYLALQIRQNSTLLQLAATKNTQDDADRWRAYLIENKDIASLYRLGMQDPDSLDADDRLRFRMLMDQLFYGWQAQFTQLDVDYHATREYWVQTLLAPGGRKYWETSRQRFNPVFVEYVDEFETVRASRL